MLRNKPELHGGAWITKITKAIQNKNVVKLYSIYSVSLTREEYHITSFSVIQSQKQTSLR